MKKCKGLFGFLGVCCMSLCFLGLPILTALIPASWMGSNFFMWTVRIMVFVSLYFSVSAACEGFRLHSNFGPLLILFPAGVVLVLLSFYLVSRPVGWLAFGAFIISFFWNHALLRKIHKISCH